MNTNRIMCATQPTLSVRRRNMHFDGAGVSEVKRKRREQVERLRGVENNGDVQCGVLGGSN